MPSKHEQFWDSTSYAFVGNTKTKGFPTLSFSTLSKDGTKTCFAVDPSVEEVCGTKAYPDFESLPGKVDAAVLEVPKAETAEWVKRAAAAGIKNVWIHMKRDTPEALAMAEEEELNVVTGTCAVMYVTKGPSFHSIHKVMRKLTGKY